MHCVCVCINITKLFCSYNIFHILPPFNLPILLSVTAMLAASFHDVTLALNNSKKIKYWILFVYINNSTL